MSIEMLPALRIGDRDVEGRDAAFTYHGLQFLGQPALHSAIQVDITAIISVGAGSVARNTKVRFATQMAGYQA